MKATIGNLVLEDLTVAEAAQLARELNGQAAKSTGSPAKQKSRQPKAQPGRVLNKVQMHAWKWLASNDRPSGVAPHDYATAARLKGSTANARLKTLVTLGLAHQPFPGSYRAGETAEVAAAANGQSAVTTADYDPSDVLD